MLSLKKVFCFLPLHFILTVLETAQIPQNLVCSAADKSTVLVDSMSLNESNPRVK